MSISESPDARGREASTRYALVVARLARRWWIVVTSGLVAAVVGVGFCLLQTPIYAASATLYVTASSDSSA
ncbi:Wzz/FepE/Etk N-terminal domain-containing protein, partial [Gordonia namibiensis]